MSWPEMDMVPSSSLGGGKEFLSLFSLPPQCIDFLFEPVQLLCEITLKLDRF